MGAFRDFLRPKSMGSRPPREEPVDKGKKPAIPPPDEKSKEKPKEPTAEGALPPLPLFRPDSNIAKVKQPFSTEIGGARYDSLPAGEPPTRGTYPLHGNARAKIPNDPDTASNYRNGTSRAQSETRSTRSSRAMERSSSRASTAQARRLSGVRAPSSHRRSIPPGTAVSTDEPVTRTFSFNSTTSGPIIADTSETIASRNVYTDTSTKAQSIQTETTQPVESIHREKPKQLDTPAVPSIPGQYRSAGQETNGITAPGDQIKTQHARVTSVSSKTSTSSRTPIADEFASSTWYARDSSPTAPPWSSIHGERAFTNQPRSADLDESPQLNRDTRDLLPNSKATTQSQSSTAPPLDQPITRGRKQNRSIDRPLPVPAELRDAPWNKQPQVPASEQEPLSSAESGNDQNSAPDPSASSRNFSKPFATEGISQQLQIEGIPTRHTESTTRNIEQKPAVLQENVKPTVHNIKEEQITREYHTHTVHHRILPVVDVQVLPTKHYVPAPSGSDGFVEVPANSVPGRAADDYQSQNWVIAETVSRSRGPKPLSEEELHEPRRFTARNFEGTEGDYKEWTDEKGIKRSETTWVHPPRLVPIETQPIASPSKDQALLTAPTQPPISQSEAAESQRPAQIAAATALNTIEIENVHTLNSSGENELGQTNAKMAAQIAASKFASH